MNDPRPSRLPVAHAEQSAAVLRLALGLLACAAAAALLFGEAGQIVGILGAIVAVLLLLICGGMSLLNRSLQRDLRRIEAGHHRLHWRFDPETWTRMRKGFERQRARRVWLVPLGLSVSGLVVGILAHDDGTLFWGSVPLTYLIPIVGGAALGLVIALVGHWIGNATPRLMARLPGECIVGERGLYLTGQYWPWAAFGQRLQGVAMSDGPPRSLRFTFVVYAAENRSTMTVAVPVPSGQEAVAAALAADLNAERGSRDRSAPAGPAR